MFNMLPLNPAYAGSQEYLSLTTTFRKQWLNMDGAPSTQTFSAHSPIKNKNIALGFSAVHDKIAVTSKTGFYGVYAYRINFNNKSKLSLGLQAGLINVVARLSQLQTKLPNDPAVSADKTTYLVPGFGAGLYWYSEKFYLGASVPDLFEARSKKEGAEVVRNKHLFMHAGIVYKLSAQLKHMPGILFKGVKGASIQYDINNVFIFHDVLWLGVSYRSATSLNFIIQAQLTNQLTFGYSYDVPLNSFNKAAGPTHELRLNYKFVFIKDNAFMPRYF
jgi:type IX secretion system PorP/SprF family membrane protein